MHKLIAILFLMLLGSITLVQGMQLRVDVVEQLADNDKGKDAQPDKKDGKEYEASATKKQQELTPALQHYISLLFFWLPRPALKKPTPPPNCIC